MRGLRITPSSIVGLGARIVYENQYRNQSILRSSPMKDKWKRFDFPHFFSILSLYAHTQLTYRIYRWYDYHTSSQLSVRYRRDDDHTWTQWLRQVIPRTLYHGASEVSSDRTDNAQ
jgi:hypothetical protein